MLLEKFLINCKILNERFNIIPLLYGSLGLQKYLNVDLGCDDIDILIPSKYINVEWESFKQELERLGYILVDLHEHTFMKNGVSYSYASIEGLNEFVGIQVKDLSLVEDTEIKYYILNLEQFLEVYKKSSLDGYRINKKEKQDYMKIELIKSTLEKKKHT